MESVRSIFRKLKISLGSSIRVLALYLRLEPHTRTRSSPAYINIFKVNNRIDIQIS